MGDRGMLLVAGPAGVVAEGERAGDLAGAGVVAAIAAAPVASVQLWSRGGVGIEPRVRDILTRRRIDLAGVEWTGPTPRESADGAIAPGPFLPEATPTGGDDVGAVLIAGLGGAELLRAVRAARALPGGETRPLLVWRGGATDSPDADAEARNQADVWIVRQVGPDPLAQARGLQASGEAKCVIVTADALGGVIVYGQKATTYPALPEPAAAARSAGPGAGAAFAGVLAAWCAGKGKADFSAIKRGSAMASAVAGSLRLGPPSRKLLGSGMKEYIERFNKLRRVGKY